MEQNGDHNLQYQRQQQLRNYPELQVTSDLRRIHVGRRTR